MRVLAFRSPRARRVVAWSGVWAGAMAAWSCGSTLSDLNPAKPVAAVVVSPGTVALLVGQQQPLQATVQDADGNRVTGTVVLWSVRDTRIATVSPSGVVTGLVLGTTQVAASSNGQSGIASITVQPPPVASVVVTPPQISVAVGVRTTFTAAVLDAGGNALSGRTVTWASSNPLIAGVDASGVVTPLSVGAATITATSEGKNGTSTITVTQAAVATVSVTPSPLSMSVGQATQLTATARDAGGNALTGQTFQWTTSNSAVATVATDGTVTAVSAGSATITATTGGKSGTAAITVSDFAVGSVTVQPQGPQISQNASQQLTATVRDVTDVIVTNRLVTWTTSNSGIATVSNTGLVTGLNPGDAIITATSEGKSGTTTVTVLRIPVVSVTVQPTTASVSIGKTTALTATARDGLNIPLGGRTFTWTSSNAAVATVSATGVVTGVALGSVTITATSEGKSGTATITVTN
jgi:uncharacterized protein YjdB